MNYKKNKICFVTSCLSGGGAERVIATVASYIAKENNFDVTMIAYNESIVTYSLDQRVKYIAITEKGRIQKIKKIRKLLKSFDCIISFDYSICIRVYIASIFMHKKHIMSERNDPRYNISKKYVRLAREFCYSKADKVVFQTKPALDYFTLPIRKKGEIIANPVDIARLPVRNTFDNKKIIAVGRLEPQKNFSMLLDAFYEFCKVNVEYKLYIFGDGSGRESLLKKVQSLNLQKRVYLKHYSKDIFNEYCSSDFFVSSSNYEGISNAMLEALSIGLPVITTDCNNGGVRQFVHDGENGFVIPVEDVEAMKDKLLFLAENREMQIRMSKNAIQIRDIVSINKIGKQWISLINNVLD